MLFRVEDGHPQGNDFLPVPVVAASCQLENPATSLDF